VRHLTSIRELTKDAAISLLDNAQQLSQVNDREVKKLPALRGKTVVNLFFENSTRTRISFRGSGGDATGSPCCTSSIEGHGCASKRRIV
jgi:aspartate carbamoyltransferase catalytic subunit